MNNQENQEKREARRLPGFYIALCCCVIAVGIAGYFTERASDKSETPAPQTAAEETEPREMALLPEEGGNASGSITHESDSEPETADNSIYAAPGLESAAQTSEEAQTVDAPQVIYEDMSASEPAQTDETAEAAALFTSPSFALPASGEILEGFTDALAYNTAMGDWRTHNGADIAVDAGGSVCAAADGTVSKISSDAMGEYVVLEHDGGFSTKYCGLSSVEDIAEGDSVAEGDVIGIVADARAENVTDSHVHFELYKDGDPVDPMKYTG